jgi:hypothetical protein
LANMIDGLADPKSKLALTRAIAVSARH